MVNRIRIIFLSFSLSALIFSCSKNNDVTPGNVVPPVNVVLSYGDSVFYLRDQSADYIITPTQTGVGRYSGFPEGIEIDQKTGAINISKSETGLRYRVSFKPDDATDSVSTVILISGINFLDGFYKLTTDDSIAKPIYNGSKINAIPGANNGSVFDEGSNCNSAGCNVNVLSGTINLAQTVRNGVFGSSPSNNDRHEFEMNYRINDKSNKSLNTLKVKLYYFNSISDVTQEVYDIMADRQGTLLRNSSLSSSGVLNKPIGVNRKPRPPCIFILAK
ncbi:MAG: hypothetical protein ABI707_07455 [Ferruginibacter sp.]